MNNEKFVLDACAIIALLKKETGAETVRDIIKNKTDILLHSVTLLEVYYDLLREIGENNANMFIDDATIKTAGFFKTNHKVSLGDTFVLATALLNSATLVTSDRHEFETIEQTEKNINILWIR